MKLASRCIGLLLALMAVAVSADSVDDITKAARADCESLDNGEFSADPAAVVRQDLNGDGVAETLIDTALFSCSSSASLFAANGGSMLHALVGGRHYTWQTLRWELIDWQGDSVLLLALHGSHCNGYGYERCIEAIVFNDDRATSVGDPTRDSAETAAVNRE